MSTDGVFRLTILPCAAVFVSILVVLASVCYAQSSLEKLKNELQAASPLALRGFPESDRIRYDTQGRPLNLHSGMWTIYGLIAVNDMDIKANEFRLRGSRMAAIYDDKLKSLQFRRYEDEVELRIPYVNGTQLEQALRNVFILAPERLSDAVPQPWQTFLRNNEQPPAHVEAEVPPGPLTARPCKPPDEMGAYRVCKDVTAPSPKRRLEPTFHPFARRFHLQGMVSLAAIVGEDGHIRSLEIIKPAGAGLDEQALAAVSTWTFKPGKKAGTPVPIRITIDIDFHLYN